MTRKKQRGFTLLETIVALAILFAVGAIVMSGMVQMMKAQGTIANRTDMHTSVRSATELMQQEIGQAGRMALGTPTALVTLTAAVVAGSGVSFTLTAVPNTQTPKVYVGEYLTVDLGSNQESVFVDGGTGIAPTGTFLKPHAAGVPVTLLGAFGTGIVPPATAPYTNGSSSTVLKLYGDINGDGKMVYVEYQCSPGTVSNPGFLYRHQMDFDQATAKTSPDNTMILLSNVLQPTDSNGNNVPCFAYQVQPLGASFCVTNVAVTLTVQTQNVDPVTRQFQQETKALLNVAPRNVVEVYATANLTDPTRAQQMPATVTALLNP
jgi:prepilin-type N-terminal cleavage/methylation domain-containing protein